MPRPSREKKREQKRSASSAVPEAVPMEVRVPAAGPGTGTASIGGVRVVAADGEEIEQAVLNHLHRIALATGHVVRATVQDERIGFVVPIRISVDGSSEFAGEPVRVAVPAAPPPAVPTAYPGQPSARATPPREPERPRPDKQTHVLRAVEEQGPTGGTTAPTFPLRAVPESAAGPRPPHPTAAPGGGTASTHVLRAVPEEAASRPERAAGTPAQPRTHRPTPEPAAHAAAARPPVRAPEPSGRPAVPQRSAPVQPPSPVREPSPARYPAPAREPAADSRPAEIHESAAVPPPPAETPDRPGCTAATFVLRAVPEQEPLISATSGPAQVLPEGGAVAPGTVPAPTGTFGPPPVLTMPEPAPAWKAPVTGPDKPKTLRPDFALDPDSHSAPVGKPSPAPPTAPAAGTEEAAKEPPVREFDSVAEAVLAPEPESAAPGGTAGPVAEPLARINEAVKHGRIKEAAGMAEQAVAEAATVLGDTHPDVLRLQELTAYIAYLAGDALRSFHLSLDLARLRHRLRDPRGAYGNVQSAAAAWRAVRDPMQGLHLGRDLIAVWTELAANEGPAADDLDQLEKARSRMGRLAERARTALGGAHPYAR
ncbi:hypothetical protein ACFSL4_23000 [Streptomyces caeni]|uniref:Tetratricopeptide repeat protein n=1 Tax=Streptomyces caeni TaxID=2307231 RepID=A0ABW4IUD5_9ACTN